MVLTRLRSCDWQGEVQAGCWMPSLPCMTDVKDRAISILSIYALRRVSDAHKLRRFHKCSVTRCQYINAALRIDLTLQRLFRRARRSCALESACFSVE